MGRTYCSSCHYPEKTCICKWVKPIESPIEIIILQHGSEASHAKNTVKLLELGLNRITTVCGEEASNFQEIASECALSPEKYAVCFPSEQSTPIEESVLQWERGNASQTFEHVIFIDASWRKALKVWHLNPWLHQLKTWHFSEPPENQYRIRKTSKENSLSTLESVAYVLSLGWKVDCSNLLTLLNARQQYFPNR